MPFPIEVDECFREYGIIALQAKRNPANTSTDKCLLAAKIWKSQFYPGLTFIFRRNGL